MWIDIHRSIKPYIEALSDGTTAARHIGNYLDMQSCRVRKYIMSAGWVFPGWIGFSKQFRKEFAIYSPREMLVELAKKSKEEREEHTWFGLYLWENGKTKER